MSKSKLSSVNHKSIFEHQCDLQVQTDIEFAASPYTSSLTKCCLRLRRFTTVAANPASRQFFRSTGSLHRERCRHMQNKKYSMIVHPFSIFVMRKKAVTGVLWLIALSLDPFLTTFMYDRYIKRDTHATIIPVAVSCTVNFLLFFDMISRFFVGYVVVETGEIVLEPKQIAKQYALSYFLVDCLAFLPTLVYLVPINKKVDFCIYQLELLRTLRLKTMLKDLNMTMKIMHLTTTIRTSIILAIMCLLTIHWWTCLMGAILTVEKIFDLTPGDSWFLKLEKEREKNEIAKGIMVDSYTTLQDYLQFFTLVLCHFFGAGTGRFYTEYEIEMFFLSLILISGFCFNIFTVAKIIKLFGVVNIAESKYEELVIQTGEYMFAKQFPPKIRKRIRKYYNYKFNRTFFSEHTILNSLSEHLRLEVLLYSCRVLVDKVQIFKGLSKAAVGSILSVLQQEVYLAKDVIMRSEDNTGTLYFILNGTCAVVLLSGKEAMHINDGQHFGEIKEFAGRLRKIPYNVVALEPCEIYSLSESDIKFCCNNYPEIAFKLEAMSHTKAKTYNALLTMAQTEDDDKFNDIIAELRRGNILYHGRRREQLMQQHHS